MALFRLIERPMITFVAYIVIRPCRLYTEWLLVTVKEIDTVATGHSSDQRCVRSGFSPRERMNPPIIENKCTIEYKTLTKLWRNVRWGQLDVRV